MQAPQDVEAMLKLASLGWGTQRIADELGCSHNTVKRYVRQGGWQPYESPARPGRLSGHAEWLAAQFRQHRGNCDVVRQELLRVHGIEVSLRTVERAVVHLRRELAEQILVVVNELLSRKGPLLKASTAVDATLIAAPSSTKNKDGQRDPEMQRSKKSNEWFFANVDAHRHGRRLGSGAHGARNVGQCE